MLNAIQCFPCKKGKTDRAMKWIGDKSSSFATRLVSFAIVEGLFSSSSFATIIWIKRKNVLPGEYISRDESFHVAHAVMLYGKLLNKLSNKDFIEIMKEAVNIEIEFITLAIPCRMIGMNSTVMISYIIFVADRLCLQLGYDKIYDPLDFMESINLYEIKCRVIVLACVINRRNPCLIFLKVTNICP